MKKLQSDSAPPALVLCNSLGHNFHQLQLGSELQLSTPLICWAFNNASGKNKSDLLRAVPVLPDRPSLLLPAWVKPQSRFIPCYFSLYAAGSRFSIQAERNVRIRLGEKPWGVYPDGSSGPVTAVGWSWLSSSLCTGGWWWLLPTSGRLPGNLWCLQNGCKASRLPSLGSISRLIYGAAVSTIWFFRFARPWRGFYSNHLFSIIEWWTASLTSSFRLPNSSHDWFPLEQILLSMQTGHQHYKQKFRRSKSDSKYSYSWCEVSRCRLLPALALQEPYPPADQSNAAQKYFSGKLTGCL